MDPKNAIELRDITKTFKIEVEDTTKKSTIFKRTPTKIVEHCVIDHISLDVQKGDVLGVIGRNGAGKSTFLSILAKIMEPDSGTIERSGKIATILELGMGFHPDMSGRENIYLKGELYGFSQEQVAAKIDQIIDYAGIREYIDNPVRTYSSGMSARLAFAIMVNVDSDIMLVDEVLSVGDTAFSYKAREHFKKMAISGKTVIFVSHNIDFLESMCNRVIWIEGGRLFRDGGSNVVCSEYRRLMDESPEMISDLAHTGVPESQYKLAILYKNGIYYQRNPELYRYWLNQAVIQGHTRSIVEYGDLLYAEDHISDAIHYYRLAASKGDKDSKIRLAKLNASTGSGNPVFSYYEENYANLSGIQLYRYASLLLATSISQHDREKAFEVFVTASEKGSLDAMFQIAIMFQNGIGVVKDLSKCIEWLEKSSKQHHVSSLILLSSYYQNGVFVPKDDEKAISLLQQAADLGNVQAAYTLATLYLESTEVDVGKELSQQYFTQFYEGTFSNHCYWIPTEDSTLGSDSRVSFLLKSAEYGNVNAISSLIGICSAGTGNEIVLTKCIKMLESLSDSGNVVAIRLLGSAYAEGKGVPKDPQAAIGWYSRGASMGDGLCEQYMKGVMTSIETSHGV